MTFQFKIQIKGITHPPVWRRILIPAKCNFHDLHITIQASLGWYNAHLFQFSPTGYGSEPIIKENYDDDYFEMEKALEPIDINLSQIFKKEKQNAFIPKASKIVASFNFILKVFILKSMLDNFHEVFSYQFKQ